MEVKLHHTSHQHPLILKPEQPKTNYLKIECDGCSTPISGPFYNCEECRYFLHKVCAELPNKLDNPLHSQHCQHTLTLISRSPYPDNLKCDLCREIVLKFVYHCSECKFDVDMICASASHRIEDKCHPHPLTPSLLPISFQCHICQTEEKGLSYKCNICPFWAHQNCTLLLPDTVRHSHHHHLLTLLSSVPFKYHSVSDHCDICHDKLFMFQCVYYCVICSFFSHASCAISDRTETSSKSRDRDFILDGERLLNLPMQQNSTDFISRFVEDYIDRDANIAHTIDHFGHNHPLCPMDEHTNEKICEACAIAISPPFYGCIECDYFLHKCCTELPKKIDHPSHHQHKLTLGSTGFFRCSCCDQWGNGFSYKCFECRDFTMDIKCASLLRPLYHKAHRHPIIPKFTSQSTCSACGSKRISQCILHCNTCRFNLCFKCAMAPPIIKHRYGKCHPFILTYSPLENHYNEYICEICEGVLNPKRWFYHCVYADQFAHIKCMLGCGADSNIKYGKSSKVNVHKHKLTFISCTYDSLRCNYCREPLRTDFSVGLECMPCNYRIHLECNGRMGRSWSYLTKDLMLPREN